MTQANRMDHRREYGRGDDEVVHTLIRGQSYTGKQCLQDADLPGA